MRAETSRGGGGRELAIEYTTKPVSGWGGLELMARFFERVDLRGVLVRALPDGRTSPNRTEVIDIALALLATVLTGGRRFEHVERLRGDEVIRAILRVGRMPSAMVLTRYFGGLVRVQVERLSEVLWNWQMSRLRVPRLGAVLDLDSTVFERYGAQQGSLKGHNPRKHGRPSHHPLIAFMAEAKMVLHAWLRSGNTSSSRGVRAFLDEALTRLPQGQRRIYAVRADSGFFDHQFLLHLEERQLPYAVVCRMTPPLRRVVAGARNWRSFGKGLEVAELPYQTFGWKQPRRLVVVREEIKERPEARGRKLFEVPGYTFHAVVTTLEFPPEEVWRFYNSRADSENRIKELKEDFGADGFCLRSFDGTEAVFRLICCLFNLVSEFRSRVLKDPAPRLSTLRTEVLVVGAILGSSARKKILRLGLRKRYRERFEELLRRVAALAASTVAQFDFSAIDQRLGPPRPWKLHPPYRRPAPIFAST